MFFLVLFSDRNSFTYWTLSLKSPPLLIISEPRASPLPALDTSSANFNNVLCYFLRSKLFFKIICMAV